MAATLAPVIPLPCELAEPAPLVMADCGCVVSADDLTTLPCGEDMCPEHATDHQRHADCLYCLAFVAEWEDAR